MSKEALARRPLTVVHMNEEVYYVGDAEPARVVMGNRAS